MEINELIIYQVDKKDRNRFNNHAYRNEIKLHSFSLNNVIVFIYMPKKSLYLNSVILNQEEVSKFILFEIAIKKSTIKFYRKIYIEKDYLDMYNSPTQNK